MDVKEEALLGAQVDSHWYYRAKGRALLSLLDGVRVDVVTDVGAGSGFFSRQVLDAGIARKACCVDPAYAQERVERYHGCDMVFTRSTADAPRQLVLMMDVLEHVADDVALLRQYTEAMADDGRVLVTVPAFQFLWSGHDVFLEHYRRYTLASLEAVVRQAGLVPLRRRYFFGLLFPAAAGMRLWRRYRMAAGADEARSALRRHSPWMNALLTKVHDVERRALFPFNRWFGLTVFCLARSAAVVR